MGSRIAGAAVAGARAQGGSSVDLSVRAAKAALRAAGVGADEVGLLINAGVYRDRHIVEPAIASFIQRKVGANVSLNGTAGTFSFDVSNGACGAVTGLMLADGFLASGTACYGLVVAGDSEPVPGRSEGYGYAPVASAFLLSPGADDDGFLAFRADADTSGLGAYDGRMVWSDEEPAGHRLHVTAAGTYVQDCVSAAAGALTALLEDNGLALADVDLVLPSQTPAGLVDGLREATGLGERVVAVSAAHGDVHTAAVGAAYERAVHRGRVKPGGTLAFLSVGAGIATSLALYRVPR